MWEKLADFNSLKWSLFYGFDVKTQPDTDTLYTL